ncbi:MAG: succinylglutamate desuccinylase/aspartoacylase family protein [Pseudomonadota bacterium]
MTTNTKNAAFQIAGETIAPGERRIVDLPISVLSNHTPVNLSVKVVNGRRAGPVFFVSAAVHGDEIMGVEIIRRVLGSSQLRQMRGTLLAVPVVNAFGFISHSRYLPDRRDLNRTFPGSDKGSLAAQLADLFLNEVVLRADFGIDLHTAAIHRTNLPQIRYSNPSAQMKRFASVFGAPVVIEADERPGTLRQTARERGVEMLLYEAGEALRFDEFSVRIGVRGILTVMRELGMLTKKALKPAKHPPIRSRSSYWMRADAGGILRAHKTIGDLVESDEVVGYISDPFGDQEVEARVRDGGLVIGRTNLPVVNQGDALFHIARVSRRTVAEDHLDEIEEELVDHPLFDEDEII